MRTKLLVLALALLALACGNPDAPTPLASPSPSPSPSPTVNVCDVLRVDIVAVRTDEHHEDEVVTAWPLGIVPMLTIVPKFRGDAAATVGCPEIDVVSWQSLGPAPCVFHGNFNSSHVSFQCFDSGDVIVKAVPQGYSIEPGLASFRIQGQ